MGLSLADAAVRGTASTTIADEKQALLAAGDTEGLIALNHSLFGSATMMAKDDADDDHDDEDDDLDDEDDDEDDEDDDEDDEDEDKSGKRKRKQDPKDRRIQELAAESKKHRLKASQRGKRIRELEQEIADLKAGKSGKPKGKDDEDEDDKSEDSAEAKRLKQENEALQERLATQALRLEFTNLTTGSKPLAQFKNPAKAFRLLDLDDVEIEDDGEIIGLDDAVKALAKSDPYLLVSSKDDDEDDEDDEDEVSKRRRRKTGQPTGSRKKGNPNRDKLVSKYPALRR